MTVEQPVRKSAHARTKSIFKPTVRIVVLLYIEPRTLKAALMPKEPQPLCQSGCYSSVRWLSQGYSVEMQPLYREGDWGDARSARGLTMNENSWDWNGCSGRGKFSYPKPRWQKPCKISSRHPCEFPKDQDRKS